MASRGGERKLAGGMILEDTAAFVERLEVDLEDKRVEKQRRRVRAARAAMLQCQSDVRIALEYLAALGSAGMSDGSSQGDESISSFTRKKQRELERRGKGLKGLEEDLERLGARRRSAVTFRLHSAEHHVDCSGERFADLEAVQRRIPRLLLKHRGRQWWWYSDRFWWDDARLSSRALAAAVRELDLMAALQRHLADAARSGTLDSGAYGDEGIPDSVRLAVWRRNGGCCADCGSEVDLRFVSARPPLDSSVGSGEADDGGDVTLLCKTCSALRTGPGWGSAVARTSPPRSARDGQAAGSSSPGTSTSSLSSGT